MNRGLLSRQIKAGLRLFTLALSCQKDIILKRESEAVRERRSKEVLLVASIVQSLAEVVKRFAEDIAIVDGKRRIKYRELLPQASALAPLLAASPSENIGILLPTSYGFIQTFLASELSGKTPVPLNFFLPPEAIAHIVADAQLDTILTTKTFTRLLPEGIQPLILEEIAPGLKPDTSFLEPLPRGPEPAVILYTSGTTGSPKGVMLSQENLLANTFASISHYQIDETYVILGILPLFHTFALVVTMLLPLLAGARGVFLPTFDASAALKAISAERVNTTAAVAPIYRLFIRSQVQGKYDSSSLKIAIAGGGPVTLDLEEEFERVFGIPILEGYGLTETTCVVSANPPGKNKPGTAGVPLETIEVKIMDDEGHEPAPSEEGEIWVKGPTVMQGYLNRPDETKEVLTPDGWLKTGDIGRLDEDGYLIITGRKKELIKIGGENVWPQDVEDVLERHEEVAEAAVKGVPDKLRGEVPKAFVVLKEGAKVTKAALRDFCRKHLAVYEVPRHIEFRDSLPKGPTGKILKRAL